MKHCFTNIATRQFPFHFAVQHTTQQLQRANFSFQSIHCQPREHYQKADRKRQKVSSDCYCFCWSTHTHTFALTLNSRTAVSVGLVVVLFSVWGSHWVSNWRASFGGKPNRVKTALKLKREQRVSLSASLSTLTHTHTHYTLLSLCLLNRCRFIQIQLYKIIIR